MSKRTLLIIAALVLLIVIAIALWVAFSGEYAAWSQGPIVRSLWSYVRTLQDVNRIEVFYRPGREWIDEPDRNPQYEETTLIITEQTWGNRIQQVVSHETETATAYQIRWTSFPEQRFSGQITGTLEEFHNLRPAQNGRFESHEEYSSPTALSCCPALPEVDIALNGSWICTR